MECLRFCLEYLTHSISDILNNPHIMENMELILKGVIDAAERRKISARPYRLAHEHATKAHIRSVEPALPHQLVEDRNAALEAPSVELKSELCDLRPQIASNRCFLIAACAWRTSSGVMTSASGSAHAAPARAFVSAVPSHAGLEWIA